MAGLMTRFFENSLDSLGEQLGDAEKRRLLLAKWFRRFCRLVRFSVLGYVSFLGLLWMAFRYVGEYNLTLSFLLYLPPVIWAIPLLPLLFLALLFDRWSFLLGTIGAALAMYGLYGWVWNPTEERPEGDDTLTVFSFNRGQSGGATQRPFIRLTKPDILVFQDANARSARMLRSPGYEDFKYGDDIGEFTLLGQFPVLSKLLIYHRNKPIAARFTLDYRGTEIAIYAVHFRTPRAALLSMRRGAFLWGVLGIPGTPWAHKRRVNEQFWNTQIESAEVLLDACREEKIPYLVVGDFNAPAQGHIHQRLTRELTDAHEAAGSGGGYTFPGKTNNPLAFRQPWLRIDKILCSDHWQVKWSIVEPEQPSQHRSVVASMLLKP